MTKKLWGGRFKKKVHPEFEVFGTSLPVDYRLAPYDLKATAAHCRMLSKIGLIKSATASKIVKALEKLGKNLSLQKSVFLSSQYEDIHSWIEAELVRAVGDDAKRIHAARSRNDQVSQATRMYCKDHLKRIDGLIAALQKEFVRKSREYDDVAIAGMTHMQKAQPIWVAHQFLGYVEALERNKGVLRDAVKRVDVLPLGSGAVAGSNLPIDRQWVKKTLGFGDVTRNSWDTVGARDFAAEIASGVALLGVQLSRMAEDFMIGQLEEIGVFDAPEELCTGSSMMPQKKNSDFLELTRGAASVFIGNATALLTLLKGLPGSYNRDLQWDKKALFDSVELIEQVLSLFVVFAKGLKVNRLKAAATLANDQLCATDLAEYLVAKGLPFREAHERVGHLVAFGEEQGIRLREILPADVKRLLGRDIKDYRKVVDPVSSLHAKRSEGSTGTARVQQEIKRWEKIIHASV